MAYHAHETQTMLAPDSVYGLEAPLQPMADRLRTGNRIRLDIANGDSAVTDGQFAHANRPDKVGSDTFYHYAVSPSRLVLPVLASE
jgi:predicted acyl esterase